MTILCLIFSVLYVIWYRSDRPHQRAHGTSTVAVLGETKYWRLVHRLNFIIAGLFMSLVTSILVPVDIFLVSFMKNSDGKKYNSKLPNLNLPY